MSSVAARALRIDADFTMTGRSGSVSVRNDGHTVVLRPDGLPVLLELIELASGAALPPGLRALLRKIPVLSATPVEVRFGPLTLLRVKGRRIEGPAGWIVRARSILSR